MDAPFSINTPIKTTVRPPDGAMTACLGLCSARLGARIPLPSGGCVLSAMLLQLENDEAMAYPNDVAACGYVSSISKGCTLPEEVPP